MALDYFHAEVTDANAIHKIGEYVKFRPTGYLDTMEEIYPFEKELDGLTYKIIKFDDKSIIYITGSLHKFYNLCKYGKSQNFDDFTFTLQQDALNMLAKKLECSLEDLIIKSFEFGINIRSGYSANELIHTMYYYDRTITATEKGFNNSGLQKIFKRDSYLTKIYNKSQESELYNHEGLSKVNDLIRLEVKYSDKDYCNKGGNIYCLDDFRNLGKVTFLYKELQKHWSKILMYDSTQVPNSITKNDLKWFNKCIPTNYFSDPNKENFKGINQTRVNHYKKFLEVLDKYNYRSHYRDLTILIEYKCAYLSTDNTLVELIMETLYIEIKKYNTIAKPLLINAIETLISTEGDDEKSNRLVDQGIQRLINAGHIKEHKTNPTQYSII